VSIDFLDLSIHQLGRHFGRRRALSKVSFDCRANEIVGLLGPNGAGKSTLLAVISTLAQPSTGEVRYGGRTAKEIGAALRSKIGVLSHDLHLYPELTARENLIFFARMYAVSNPAVAASDALARARLSDRGDEVISGYSRGMRQRLALERALLHRPRLLLLDEPFTGLDDASTADLIARLKELRSAGCITLLATHDLDTAEAVLDRAVILRDGRLMASEQDIRGLRKRYQVRLQAAVPTA
jgi:ABC-type multidrug transport system ATPase subunit